MADVEESSLISNDALTSHLQLEETLLRKKLNKCLLFAKTLLAIVTLVSLVVSKISLLEISYRFQSFKHNASLIGNSSHGGYLYDNADTSKLAANLYWQLLFTLLIPNLITVVRCLWNGMFLDKKNLWPTPKLAKVVYIFVIFVMAFTEGFGESVIVFVVLPNYPPEVLLFLFGAVLVWQSSRCKREDDYSYEECSFTRFFISLFAIFALGLAMIFYYSFDGSLSIVSKIAFAGFTITAVLVTSVFWSFKLERKLFKLLDSQITGTDEECNSLSTSQSDFFVKEARELTQQQTRWRINLISSLVRTLVYPITCFVLFRYTYTTYDNSAVDPYHLPWDSSSDVTLRECFLWERDDTFRFLIHILSTLVGFILIKLACITAMHSWGLILPLALGTPVTIVLYLLFHFVHQSDSPRLTYLRHFHSPTWALTLVFITLVLLWFALTSFSLYKLFGGESNKILSTDADMFFRPYYNSFFFEQSTILNRSVEPRLSPYVAPQDNVKIFICSTMYKENVTEMTQLLESIYKVAFFMCSFPGQSPAFQSHIFFDDGCSQKAVSRYAVQLFDLIPRTLKLSLEDAKIRKTPYGIQFEWLLMGKLRFVVHLKDSFKVKKLKRWSQVMYMRYIIKYLASNGLNFDLENSYILTTDADVQFTMASILVLLDIITSNPHIGGVCPRTHPKGSGLIYWYQIFDYAVSQWFQKPAEHILGSVLCCPGCFSLFRCQAMNDALDEYSTEVLTAIDFLAKDMGEDRWLTILMIRNGWKMEYCSLSQDSTYCPTTFEDFFQQRRRWISSTIAHLVLFISHGRFIVKRNSKITWLFILYQVLMLFTSAISPSTTILIISSGFEEAYSINGVIIVIVLSLFCFFYTCVCLLASKKTQFEIGKTLSLLLTVLMVIVLLGIMKQSFVDIVNITQNSFSTNSTNSSPLTLHYTTIYIWLFIIVYFVAGILHLYEVSCLAYGFIYLAGIPFAQMILVIYTAGNVSSRSWGTRESGTTQSDMGLFAGIYHIAKRYFGNLLKLHKGSDGDREIEPLLDVVKDNVSVVSDKKTCNLITEIDSESDYSWLSIWLKEQNAQKFLPEFVKNGYTEEWLVAGITGQDLREIGIYPEGYIRRLKHAVEQLPKLVLYIETPNDVGSWLKLIKMENLSSNFERAGYFMSDDIGYLKGITKDELVQEIGVTKRAHVKWIMDSIKALTKKYSGEDPIKQTERLLEKNLKRMSNLENEEEIQFWEDLSQGVLRPITCNVSHELLSKFRILKKNILLLLFLFNTVWVIALYSSSFPQLGRFTLNSKPFAIVFLSVYGCLLLLQFVSMVCHRIVSFCHYLARLNKSKPLIETLTNY